MSITRSDRIIAVTVTPFKEGITPDLDEIAKQTEGIAASAADGILPCASTGEAVKLDMTTRDEMLRVVSEANNGRKTLIAGACDVSVEAVSHYIEVAKKYNYNACLVCPPYYYGLSQDAVLDFYKKVNTAAEGMAIVAYHVPFFTTGIELSTFERMLELPNIVGIKDSSAVMKRIAHTCDIAATARPEFQVYTGTDDCLLPALTAGCVGSMTALGATLPHKLRAIYDAFDASDIATAMKIQRSIEAVLRASDRPPFPIGYKLHAEACGLKIEPTLKQQYKDDYEKIKALTKQFTMHNA